MNSFSDGAPRSYMEWLELGYTVFPCSPDLEINSTCWDFKHNAKGGK